MSKNNHTGGFRARMVRRHRHWRDSLMAIMEPATENPATAEINVGQLGLVRVLHLAPASAHNRTVSSNLKDYSSKIRRVHNSLMVVYQKSSWQKSRALSCLIRYTHRSWTSDTKEPIPGLKIRTHS